MNSIQPILSDEEEHTDKVKNRLELYNNGYSFSVVPLNDSIFEFALSYSTI